MGGRGGSGLTSVWRGSNLANTASLLWHAYHSLPYPSDRVNWAGMCILSSPLLPRSRLTSIPFPARITQTNPLFSPLPQKTGFYTQSAPTRAHPYVHLILGPFHGKPACQVIEPDRGVCGRAYSSKRALVVPDTHRFPGHIACDAMSRSEIVVPVIVRGDVVALIDIDCTAEGGFDGVDEEWLGKLAGLLGESCDWEVGG